MKKVTLQKQKTWKEQVNEKLIKYFPIICCFLILAGIGLFVAACFAYVPPVESGVYYNHLNQTAAGYYGNLIIGGGIF